MANKSKTAQKTVKQKSAPADIPAAKTVEPSGAPDQVTDVDLGHPAVDANPREQTTEDQNRIDFNDPTISGAEAVARHLAEQGQASKTSKD